MPEVMILKRRYFFAAPEPTYRELAFRPWPCPGCGRDTPLTISGYDLNVQRADCCSDECYAFYLVRGKP